MTPDYRGLENFLFSEACELPLERDTKMPLPDQLACANSMFLQELASGPHAHDILTRVRGLAETLIKPAADGIVDAAATYLNGMPSLAYENLRKALEPLKPHLNFLKTIIENTPDLFRLREMNSLQDAPRREIFHVPFQLRHLVSTRRYSIPGLPCLYLGESIMVCWEELGRPPFHQLSAACFRAVGSPSVLDFGFRPSALAQLGPARFGDDYLVAYLACWPLIAACCVNPRRRAVPFIEEYAVPQMLLQWLRESEFDGIRYFSMRMSQDGNSARLAINYAFPVRGVVATGHCQRLKMQFTLTPPMPWVLIDSLDIAVQSKPRRNELYFLGPDRMQAVKYDDTSFARVEAKLQARHFGQVD